MKLTEGLPDPSQIAQQKEGYAKGIDMQFRQGSELLNSQHKQTTEWLKSQAEQRKQQYILAVDQQVRQEELQLSQKFNEQLMLLHQAAQKQRAELEQQANNLALEYQTKKTREEYMEQQYEIQKTQFESQVKLMSDMQGMGVPSQAPALMPAWGPPAPSGPLLSGMPPPWPGALPQGPGSLSAPPGPPTIGSLSMLPGGSLSLAPGFGGPPGPGLAAPPAGLGPQGFAGMPMQYPYPQPLPPAMQSPRTMGARQGPPPWTQTMGALQGPLGSTGLAAAGLDTSGDGHTNIIYVGADRRGDGIPDALGIPGPLQAGPPLYSNQSASLPEVTTRCCCGNVFMADAVYCRHCGRKRPEAVDVACTSCGSVFMADSQFCRKCGKVRDR